MKSNLSVIATLLLALALILHSNVQRAEAARSLLTKTRTLSSQSSQGLHVKEKNPYKKEKSSFRRVPPSRSNPTQNKSKPP
ncbi:hypothetical protein C2S51_011731 [Perilla frutescens var. frutescens]|nr:hypothetical protein C2S51_011731 [Perilla frutescens var. frutescens]